MEINDIKKIIYDDGIIEVLVGVELDPDSANRWELEDPNALITYKSTDSPKSYHIDLIDQGIKVHGYEFKKSDEKEISNFVEKEIFK